MSEPVLRRRLRFWMFVAITAGTPLASVDFLSMQLGAKVAGPDIVYSIVIAGFLILLLSTLFGEFTSVFPTAAAYRAFIRPVFGDMVSVGLTLMSSMVIIAAAGAETYVFANAVHYLMPTTPPLLWIFLVLSTVLVVNIFGVELSGKAQEYLTYGVFAALNAFSFYVLLVHTRTGMTPIARPPTASVGNVLTASAITIFLFLGFGRVTALAEEAKDFERMIPRAMPVGILLLTVIFALLAFTIYGDVDASSLNNTPIPHIVFAQMVGGRTLGVIMALISVYMTAVTFNAGVLSTSRLVYALAREGSLPRVFSRLSLRYSTPYAALIFLYVVALGVSVWLQLTNYFSLVLLLGSAVDAVIYSFVAMSFTGSRLKHPEWRRPFRVWGGLPLSIGIAGLFILILTALLASSAWQVSALLFSSLALAFGYAGYVTRRKNNRA